MEWWDKDSQSPTLPPAPRAKLPFDFVLFVNSAAPAIYAKEMRDFLEADRAALEMAKDPDANVPVIVSLTSTADWATGILHPIGNCLAPFLPSTCNAFTPPEFLERNNLTIRFQRTGAYRNGNFIKPHRDITVFSLTIGL